jgi:transposase
MQTSLAVAAATRYVGIDVSQDTLHVFVQAPGHKAYRLFANTPEGFVTLHTWLQGWPGTPVRLCLEATGSYSDGIATFLWEQGYYVSVLNPAILVNFRKSENIRTKTDRMDAELLARVACEKQPRPFVPLPQDILNLRALLSYRSSVMKMGQHQRNRLHAGRLTDWTREQTQQQCQRLHQDQLAAERQIRAHLRASQSLKPLWELLQSIPGVGWLGAATLIAQIGEIERFGQVGSLVSLAGLAVKAHDSGTSVQSRHQIDRHGRPELRRILYWCAMTAMRVDAAMATWANRLRVRGKPKKVVLVAMMRKLLHIVYGVWKTHTPYQAKLVLGQAA